VRRLLALLLLASLPAGEAHARWAPPVPGPPARLFDLGADPFAAGRHRGVDLAAARGEPVRAACGGVVRFAGRVAGTGTVSVSCGGWRVSYAPLERIAVRAGARVGPGRRLGRVGHPSGHAGLHLGARREGERFGYTDPLRFLGTTRRAPPPLVPARKPQRPARPHVVPRPSRPAPAPAPAPWPVWLGLALLLTGLAGAGTVPFPRPSTGGAACRASSTSSSSPTTPSRP
jgi:hypothetical protein